jgi:hypothetical protein
MVKYISGSEVCNFFGVTNASAVFIKTDSLIDDSLL